MRSWDAGTSRGTPIDSSRATRPPDRGRASTACRLADDERRAADAPEPADPIEARRDPPGPARGCDRAVLYRYRLESQSGGKSLSRAECVAIRGDAHRARSRAAERALSRRG